MSVRGCEEPVCENGAGVIDLLIEPRAKDLGEFEVRRVLPSRQRQRVGPFIFFDHMGPADFAPGSGVAVRPHPHIGLATVTFLFEGEILHRDSLGCVQPIRPGAVNLMTAGRGIVHSERTPEEMVASGSRLHGIQTWLALPTEHEEGDPDFCHYAAESLPIVRRTGATIRVVAGTMLGESSPVRTASQTLYLDVDMAAGAELQIPIDVEERAFYVVNGEVRVREQSVRAATMAVLTPGVVVRVGADEPARLLVVGGAALAGERHMFWNFVSSRPERIERAKDDWKGGRFAPVPGETDFIPLPE